MVSNIFSQETPWNGIQGTSMAQIMVSTCQSRVNIPSLPRKQRSWAKRRASSRPSAKPVRLGPQVFLYHPKGHFNGEHDDRKQILGENPTKSSWVLFQESGLAHFWGYHGLVWWDRSFLTLVVQRFEGLSSQYVHGPHCGRTVTAWHGSEKKQEGEGEGHHYRFLESILLFIDYTHESSGCVFYNSHNFRIPISIHWLRAKLIKHHPHFFVCSFEFPRKCAGDSGWSR